MEVMRSAVILAGGSSSRLGIEKPLLLFSDKPLIRLTAEKLRSVVDEIVVVVRDEGQAEDLRGLVPDALFACDRILGYGPVAGLAAGMRLAGGEYAFACGCDLPFLNLDVIERLFELARGYDASVPIRQNGLKEPLHAVYRGDKMRIACENAIRHGERKISAPLGDLRVRWVPVEWLYSFDPQLLTFFNVNTREDLARALERWQNARGES
jgi:molybdopterin-guanine dinucleotide biosynthesis protein A